MSTKEIGRPTIMTPETLSKLEEVFAIGGSDEEACFYASISKTTLYNYQQEHPEFVDRKEALKERPILKARQTIVKALDDPNHAFRYLEKKRKKEFGNDTLGIDIKGNVQINLIKYGELESGNDTPQIQTEAIPAPSITGS